MSKGLKASLHRVLAALASLALTLPAPVWAVHFDVEIKTSLGPIAGSRLETGFYGDLDLGGALPIDGQTGYKIFPGYFSDLEGGPFLTDDPGFQAFRGTLSKGDEIHFRALGTLAWWNPSTQRWGPAPAGVSLALFGGVPTNVIVGYTENPAAWQAQYDFYAAGTRFTATRVEGPLTALIDDASSSGAFHAHLDWQIQSSVGRPPAGAYLVTIELWSPTLVNGQPKYQPAQPIHIVFEQGLSDGQMRAALSARISPQVDTSPTTSDTRPPAPPWQPPPTLPWALHN